MSLAERGFFAFLVKKKNEKNEKIEIILEDLSRYLDKFKSDICLGKIAKIIKGVLVKNVKTPADEFYNKMVKVVKQLENNRNLWKETNDKLLKDLTDIEKFLSVFLQDSNKISDSVDASKGLEKISIKSGHIFMIYAKFGELKYLIFGEKFGEVDPFSNLKINFKNSLEIWGSFKSVSRSLKKLNSQRGWLFKNRFVIKCYDYLKKNYEDIKQNITDTIGISSFNPSKILYAKLQNCKTYISSAIVSRIMEAKIHPDDYDNIKSSLFDLYNAFSDAYDALFGLKFEEIDFKNFHLYQNKSNRSSALYYISVLGKDLVKLRKVHSTYKTKLYKKLFPDYRYVRSKIRRKKSNTIKCMREFSNIIIKNNIISEIDKLKETPDDNSEKISLKIINDLYCDYISIVKRFSINQINYVKKNTHPLISQDVEIASDDQVIDYLEVRKENLLNSFSNLNFHMDDFRELKSYLYKTFGKKLKLIFEKVWLKFKRSTSKEKDIYILRDNLNKQDKRLRSNFSNLYKNLNRNKKICDILKNKEKQKKFVNKLYYDYSEFEFIKKVVNDNISYIDKFYSYWDNFSISDFNEKYFGDKKVSDISKTFIRISNVVDSLSDDYKNLQKCILDVENSINIDVSMAGDNHEDSKEIKIIKENLGKLKNQESSYSSKKQKSKISKKMKSMTLELEQKQKVQLKEEIQKAIDRFNNIPVNGTKIIGTIIMVTEFMNLGPNSSLNIVVSVDKIDIFQLISNKLASKIVGTIEKQYDCGSGYSIEISRFDISVGSLAHGSIYVYMSFKNSDAGTMIVNMLSNISSESKGISKHVLTKIVDSLSKLDNLDYLYKIMIKNKISNGKLDVFPCNIVKEDSIKVDDSQINIGVALYTYKSIKNTLKPLQSSKIRKFFRGKTEFDRLLENIKQLSNEIKLASRNPEICRSLIKQSQDYLDNILKTNETLKYYSELFNAKPRSDKLPKYYVDLSNIKSQLEDLEKYLVGSTKKISKKKHGYCNVCGSLLNFIPYNEYVSILVTGESSSGVIKSLFGKLPREINKSYGMTVIDLEINTEKMDMKFLSLMANFFSNCSLCSNFNMKLHAYILTSSQVVKFFKKNIISISSKSKKDIYLR